MRKLGVWGVSGLAIVLAGACVLSARAESATEEKEFSIRKADEQVILYTLHRGSYDGAGQAIGRLFALAGQKGMIPKGNVTFTYLNNPQLTSSEHCLTEIRIPVGKEALKLAGTLGEFTDVKVVPGGEVAVAVKPEGQADPRPIYERLAAWILKQGYIPTDNASETFLTNVMSGDYTRMKTEITIPVAKLSAP